MAQHPLSITHVTKEGEVIAFDQTGYMTPDDLTILQDMMARLPRQIESSLLLLEEADRIGLTWVTEVFPNGLTDSYLMPESAI